ncbi:MAG: 2-C-methyl-D-erythritol 2,4-cyclodiphosphate synthase [Deltaproteobacteria bacterium]|nr:2-C-methyl-D-erythritol 2,4-cyclodiphosphate synthase [Deltaproteobacteria bacterium]
MFRIGLGYDLHKLVEGRDLVIGGVAIPFEKGLLGHSDADVLLHALCDALLGAAALGDIGQHFPDTDPKFEGISSMMLLEKVTQMIQVRKYRVQNVDATIMAQAPILKPYIKPMAKNISRVLDMPVDCVNIKATTTEGMGVIGHNKAIAAACVISLVHHGADHITV